MPYFVRCIILYVKDVHRLGYSVYVLCSFLQQFSQLVHHLRLVLHEGMGIAVKGDCRILVTEDFGQRFHVHAALYRACGKGVPQRVETLVRDIQSFQQQFKTPLVGADGDRHSVT